MKARFESVKFVNEKNVMLPKYPSLTILLEGKNMVEFVNGVYETENEKIIEELRNRAATIKTSGTYWAEAPVGEASVTLKKGGGKHD